ncbi:MAG: hypothetical protein QOG75_5883, partial [Mycobacterium sp.]|nr:hypothetical protein [Mycobacterium sp.]
HRIASKESVSLEMFATALKMARHRGLVDPDATADIGEKRRTLVQQLDNYRNQLRPLPLMRETGVSAEMCFHRLAHLVPRYDR